MQDILVVVDMQKISLMAHLGQKKLSAIVPKVEEKTEILKEPFFLHEILMKHGIWILRRERNFQYHTASGIQKDGRSEVNWISSEKQNRLIKILLVLQIWQMNWWQ